VEFSLGHGDTYVIRIDPGSDAWRRLGIRYVALPRAPRDPEFLEQAALVATFPEVGLRVYEFRWGAEPALR
jgi:hypothetical protein